MKPIYEIIGPDNKVHYRRPEGHPDIAEARNTMGYSVIPVSTEEDPEWTKIPKFFPEKLVQP